MEYSVKDILKLEVAPALGCTEPTAIALGAAAAVSILSFKENYNFTDKNKANHTYKNKTNHTDHYEVNNNKHEIDSIELWLDPNIFKNGLAVAIPGTYGLSGLDLAAAIGAIAGDPMLGMEVLVPITDDDVKNASQFLKQGKVKVNLLSDHRGLYVKTAIKSGQNRAVSIIEVFHDNITTLQLNGIEIVDHPIYTKIKNAHSNNAEDNNAENNNTKDNNAEDNNVENNNAEDNNTKDNNAENNKIKREKKCNVADLENSLKNITMNEIISLVDKFDSDDLNFIERGIEMNMTLARYGLDNACGLQVGATLNKLAEKGLVAKDMIHTARVLTAAAGDARMSGARLPAMSSAGSGNHGLTAIIPVKAVADYIHAKRDDLCRAVGLSHIITAFIKAHTGRLAAICACSVAAGAGAAAGIAYLFGGTSAQIGAAVENIIEDLAGVICDGAKNSCALKLDTAAGAAVQSALFAINGLNVKMSDGIVGETPEKTIRNIGILSSQGMIETDRIILKIMVEKILK